MSDGVLLPKTVLFVLSGVVFFLGASPAVPAPGPTGCVFELDVTISPGLSIEPTSGTFTSNGETGTIRCDGPVNGQAPAGPGTFGVDGTYGTGGGNTCASGPQGEFVQSFTVPTATGPQHVKNAGTYTAGAYYGKGGVATGQFQGDRFSGTLQVTPTEGDCITAPVTRVHVRGEGTFRS